MVVVDRSTIDLTAGRRTGNAQRSIRNLVRSDAGSNGAAEIFPTGFNDTLSLIRAGPAGLERASAVASRESAVSHDRLIAPLTNPGKIFGSGVNYRSHGDEEPGFVFPDEVVWDFIKVSSAIVGDGADIVIPPTDDVIKRLRGGNAKFSEFGFAVDYEVELGVVIGKTAKNVRRDQAMPYIWGYTVFNDVGARSVQFHNGQRDMAKNFATFCPMGPCIVTADELPDWQNIRLESRVNGSSASRRWPAADRAPCSRD